MAKAGCWSVLVPFPSHCSSGLRGCLVLTVVDASNRPRRRRRISRRTFRGPSVYGQFALEVGARTITTRDSRTCGLGAPDDFFVLSASAFLRAAGRDAWKRTQPSLKPSRAEPDWVFRCVPPNLCPGSRQNETNQRGWRHEVGAFGGAAFWGGGAAWNTGAVCEYVGWWPGNEVWCGAWSCL